MLSQATILPFKGHVRHHRTHGNASSNSPSQGMLCCVLPLPLHFMSNDDGAGSGCKDLGATTHEVCGAWHESSHPYCTIISFDPIGEFFASPLCEPSAWQNEFLGDYAKHDTNFPPNRGGNGSTPKLGAMNLEVEHIP